MWPVCMIIVGYVFTPKDLNDCNLYDSPARLDVKTKKGLVIGQVILDDPKMKIGIEPQRASIIFPRIVEFEEGQELIDLHRGKNLVGRFRVYNINDEDNNKLIVY